MSRPIEAILKSFIHHVIDLQNEEDPAGSGFHREFRILREKQIENKKEERFPMEEGKKEENIKKNRYKDILPRDDRRVRLKENPGVPGSDYINASFIDDVDGHQGYIAAQGPMPHTVNDFWRMLWQYKIEIVFMVCRMKEDGKAKCEKYWADEGESVVFGNIKVHTLSEEEIQDHFIKRHLHIQKKGAIHKLTQFHYVGWPDHNVPSSPDALRRMIEDVRNYRKLMNVPMVVHCSAGCGRTGTICAIDLAWTLLDKGMVSESFSMFEIIKSLREQRISMVQTPDQYEYTHMVMKSLCDEWLISFAKHDYENVTLCNERPEEPEEDYFNIDFHQDRSNTRDSTGSSKASVRESGSAAQSSKPIMNKKPDVRMQKPEITRTKPEAAMQKPDVPQKPHGYSKSSASAAPTHSRTASEGRDTAGQLSSQTPTSLPPSLQDKKNPRGANQHSLFFQGDGVAPKIGKSGSAGRSAMRQKVRPLAAQAVMEQGVRGQAEDEDGEEDVHMYEVVDKNKKRNRNVDAPLYENQLLYENHQVTAHNSLLLADGNYDVNYANEVIVPEPTQDQAPPALPSRHYRPDEVATSSDKPQAPESGPPARHKYNNVQPTSQPQPASSPHPKGNVHRMQQPIPTNPQLATHHTRGGQAVSPRTARQAVADSSSTVIVGQTSSAVSSRPNFNEPRPGWMDSASSQSPVKRDFPAVFTGGGYTHLSRDQPRVTGEGYSHILKDQSNPQSGGGQQGLPLFQKIMTLGRSNKGGQKHIVAAPGPGQTFEARSGKPVYVMERLPRVRGPRPLPAGWPTTSKNQRITYL